MATKYEDYTVEELRNELRSIMSDPNPLTEEEMQRLDHIMAVLDVKDPLPKEESHVTEMWEQFKRDHADAITRLSEG